MTIRIKKVIRADQWIVFIFVWKLFKRVQLRDKTNIIERNRVITRKIMFRLNLRKKLQVSKMYFWCNITIIKSSHCSPTSVIKNEDSRPPELLTCIQ